MAVGTTTRFDLGRMQSRHRGRRRTQHGFETENLGNGARRGPTAGDLQENGLGLGQNGVDVDRAGHIVDVLQDFGESKFIFHQNRFLGVEESDADEQVEIATRMTRPQNLYGNRDHKMI